jgi:SPP1 gp7 family putative phage head morphogenesis protein
LSRSIWNSTSKAKKDINTIIAEGIAQNKSTYDIAKDLEKYVNPSAKKDWAWSKVYPGTNKVVDYNAQRLARTMVSHAYQQAFVRVTKPNPFVTKYRWLASNSNRVCELCNSRDGVLFEKDDLPMDHPNGMCTFTAVIDQPMTDIADRIADWALGQPDSELDTFAQFLQNS